MPDLASLPVSADDIRAAERILEGVVRPTPLEYSRALSAKVGADVYLKCENLQRAGSFKIRGAYTRIAGLTRMDSASLSTTWTFTASKSLNDQGCTRLVRVS